MPRSPIEPPWMRSLGKYLNVAMAPATLIPISATPIKRDWSVNLRLIGDAAAPLIRGHGPFG